MRVLLSPQFNLRDKVSYQFYDNKIIVTVNGESDEFDFTDLPDGELEYVETYLTINPISSVKKVNGILEIELINFIGINATEDERFPEWKVV